MNGTVKRKREKVILFSLLIISLINPKSKVKLLNLTNTCQKEGMHFMPNGHHGVVLLIATCRVLVAPRVPSPGTQKYKLLSRAPF